MRGQFDRGAILAVLLALAACSPGEPPNGQSVAAATPQTLTSIEAPPSPQGLFSRLRREAALELAPKTGLRRLEPARSDPEFRDVDHNHIVIKFREGSSVRLRAGALRVEDEVELFDTTPRLSRQGIAPATVNANLDTLNGLLRSADAEVARKARFAEESDLSLLRLSAERSTGAEHADLNLYYDIVLSGDDREAATALLGRIRDFPSVETAYFQPIPINASDIPPRTMISLAQRQDYLRAAPLGIDVDFARTQRGGLGTRVNIADIEYGWDRDHEDFPSTSRILFDRVQRDSDAAHGTAVIGILWAEDNGFGVTGIVPEARIGRVSPYFDTPKGKDIRDVGAAMLYAADRMEIGDIILLEQQAPGTGSVCPRQEDEPQTCGQWGYLPIESIPYDYDVISTLTGRGYIIIEAAGNGEQRIDRVPGRDSGAIMVGSSDPITHIPSWFTNFGSRVDVHAWGAGIATLGYGEDPARRPNSAMRADGRDYRQWYTGDFGGTSGASPIVAGAAAIIQSNRRARGARDLDSRTMRSLLASTGTPQHTDMRQIGPQPDLRKALAASATLSAQR